MRKERISGKREYYCIKKREGVLVEEGVWWEKARWRLVGKGEGGLGRKWGLMGKGRLVGKEMSCKKREEDWLEKGGLVAKRVISRKRERRIRKGRGGLEKGEED